MKVAVIDDQEYYTKVVEEALKEESMRNEEVRVRTFQNGFDFIQTLDSEYYDLVFLDLELGKVSGLTIIEECFCKHPEIKTKVIIITSHDHYISEAFKYKEVVFQYLRKPFSKERIREEYFRAKNTIIEELPHLSFSIDHKNYSLRLDEIIYIESYYRYYTVHSTRGTFQVYGRQVRNFLTNIDDFYVIRLHQSFHAPITSIKYVDGYDCVMKDGTHLTLTPRTSQYVNKMFNIYGGRNL